MIFGKDNTEWESLKGIFTATEINQQPATWRKTIKQIEDNKDALKAFIENVTKNEDYDRLYKYTRSAFGGGKSASNVSGSLS